MSHIIKLHGRKKIYTYPERLGLRKHILKCGDFLDFYDALVVLEDDLVVAPSFYMYVLMTVNKYIENNNIAGISLYTHLWNHNAGLPFTPCANIIEFCNYTKLTSHEERLSTSLITPILLPSGECLAVVVYIR